MKRLLMFIVILLFILVCLNTPNVFGQPKHITESYSKQLNEHVYPIIKKHLKKYKYAITVDEAQQAVNEIDKKLIAHFSKEKLPIFDKPMISIVKLQTETHVAFVFHIIIVFYDTIESTPNFKLTTEYSKRFVVYVYNKNTVNVEKQTTGSWPLYTNTEILRCDYEIKQKGIR